MVKDGVSQWFCHVSLIIVTLFDATPLGPPRKAESLRPHNNNVLAYNSLNLVTGTERWTES